MFPSAITAVIRAISNNLGYQTISSRGMWLNAITECYQIPDLVDHTSLILIEDAHRSVHHHFSRKRAPGAENLMAGIGSGRTHLCHS
jgi:hypothetical protein